MHDGYYADDQDNTFTDDKDQCDGKGLTRVECLCTPTTQTSQVLVLKTRGDKYRKGPSRDLFSKEIETFIDERSFLIAGKDKLR